MLISIGRRIQWVPGHCGVEEREVKCEVELDERLKKVYSRKIRRIKSNRKENVIVVQLRSGHCPKTKYYRHRIGMEDIAACERCRRCRERTSWWSAKQQPAMRGRRVYRWNNFGRRIGR